MGIEKSALEAHNCTDLDIGRIQKRLYTYLNNNSTVVANNAELYQKAAVLVLLVCIDGVWNLLFTRRSDALKNHKGQVSFPGGAMEVGDKDEIATAIRETTEEIGIIPQSVQVLGKMPEFMTTSNFLLTPVIALLDWPIEFSISEQEVSKVFTIPIDWLMDSINWEERLYTHPSGWYGSVIFFNIYEGELLWGISAKITVELIQHILL